MAKTIAISRQIAYDAFIQVMFDRLKPEDCLEEAYTAHPGIKRIDKNLAKEILYGSLRWHSKIFWILQNTASRDLTKTAPPIQAALVCGTYQIFYLDRVPDRAAVNDSVEYIRQKGQASACTFVNGILRQIARRAEYFAKPDKNTQKVPYYALQYAHPEWMTARWVEAFKGERLENLLTANNTPPPYSVRINFLKTKPEHVATLQQLLLKEEKTHSERRPLRSALHLVEAPNLDPESLFQRGYYTVQDEAAQLVGYLVAPDKGQRIVDACTGPGGKLSHIFELAEGDVRLTAMDLQARQLARAQATMARLGHTTEVEWIEGDFLSWQPNEKPDKILLDAPCSGLGVLRRHPEGKWHKRASDITMYSELQRKLVRHALEVLPVGGELIYAVCSFEPEEGMQHRHWLVEQYKQNVELCSPLPRLPDYYKRYVTREQALLVYSGNQESMDGFFSIILRKTGEI